MTTYVLGFLFNKDLTQVALIKKNRPEWMAEKLNGIGGHVEENEISIDAMIREFKEETGVEVTDWIHYCTMNDFDNFVIYTFAAIGDLSKLKTITDEEVIIFNIKDINNNRKLLLSNVPWLIEMAFDKLKNNEFIMWAQINY